MGDIVQHNISKTQQSNGQRLAKQNKTDNLGQYKDVHTSHSVSFSNPNDLKVRIFSYLLVWFVRHQVVLYVCAEDFSLDMIFLPFFLVFFLSVSYKTSGTMHDLKLGMYH